MGWASFLEDIRDRLTSDMHAFRAAGGEALSIGGGSVPDSEILRRAQALFNACERVLADIQSKLEMAADPGLDMAYEIDHLTHERKRLHQEIRDLEARREGLRERIATLESRERGLKDELRAEKRRSELKDQEMERLIRESPDVAYDVYSTDDQRSVHKPEP
jgi:chromosome segregation ATPase